MHGPDMHGPPHRAGASRDRRTPVPITRPVVVVVGGGVSGLATAYYLRRDDPDMQVTLVEGADRLGGKVLTEQVAGHPVDAGPDALLLRVPALRTLLDDLALTEAIVAPGAQGAFVWSRGRLRRLPPSSLFGVPQKLWPLLRSGLLSPRGVARAALDLVLPRRQTGDVDVSVGELLRPRLGAEVFDRLVDPLLGGVHAGRADLLSARSAVPQVVALAERNRSVYLGGRRAGRAPAATGPALVTLEGGLGRRVDALAAHVDDVRLGTRVDALRPLDGRYLVRLSDDTEMVADAVVLGTPAYETGRLLADVAPEAASAAAAVPYADVASLTLVYPREAIGRELDGTGFLVPPEEGLLLVGCSWLPAKWRHLADSSSVLIRAMVGRHGDDRFASLDDASLVNAVHEELVRTMGMRSAPREARVQRWPRAMPQYTVGHQARLDRLDGALAAHPGLHVTGAAFRGVGVASCVSQAESTARGLVTALREPVAAAPA
jgi:oxygen-dependent protoporphyrinogen oxidase